MRVVRLGRLLRVEGHEQVREVRQRVADGAHLPVQEPDDAGLGPVEDHVVELVVAVHEGRAVARLQGLVGEEAQHGLEVRDLAHGLPRVDVDDAGLRRADLPPRRELAVVEPVAPPVGREAEAAEVDAVEAREGLDGGAPETRPLGGRDVGDREILEDAAVQELHDVEGRADDGVVLAEAVRPGHGHRRGAERGDHPVLALDLVRRLGEKLSRRLLAHHVPLPVRRRQLVRRVRLSEAELLHV